MHTEQVYRPSDSRAETHIGHVGAAAWRVTLIYVQQQEQTDNGQKPTHRPLLYCFPPDTLGVMTHKHSHCINTIHHPHVLSAPAVWVTGMALASKPYATRRFPIRL